MTFSEFSFIYQADEYLYKMPRRKKYCDSFTFMSPQELHYLDPKAMKCFISKYKIPVSNLLK